VGEDLTSEGAVWRSLEEMADSFCRIESDYGLNVIWVKRWIVGQFLHQRIHGRFRIPKNQRIGGRANRLVKFRVSST